jgi:hypothetical protein
MRLLKQLSKLNRRRGLLVLLLRIARNVHTNDEYGNVFECWAGAMQDRDGTRKTALCMAAEI